jgi:hypothetical protein
MCVCFLDTLINFTFIRRFNKFIRHAPCVIAAEKKKEEVETCSMSWNMFDELHVCLLVCVRVCDTCL